MVESIKNKVAIVGVGYTPQNREPGRSPISYHIEAAKNAIEDAGLRLEDVDGMLTQPLPQDDPAAELPYGIMPWSIAQRLGMRLRFCSGQQAMGASAGCIVFHAACALIYGLAKYVVCTYGETTVAGTGAGRYGGEGRR